MEKKIRKTGMTLLAITIFSMIFASAAWATASVPTFMSDACEKFLEIVKYLMIIMGAGAFCVLGYSIWRGGELANYMGQCFAVVVVCIVGYNAMDFLKHIVGSAATIDCVHICGRAGVQFTAAALAFAILYVVDKSIDSTRAAACKA